MSRGPDRLLAAYRWPVRPAASSLNLGVAVVDADSGQLEALLKAAGDDAVLLAVEPERFCSATPSRSTAPPDEPGVTYEAEILAGKVLDNAGGGSDGWILAGLKWAVTQKAAVISMSLGAAVAPGTPHSRVFETVARRALAQGSLIVAAAGNESDRHIGHTAPVGQPANSPSVSLPRGRGANRPGPGRTEQAAALRGTRREPCPTIPRQTETSPSSSPAAFSPRRQCARIVNPTSSDRALGAGAALGWKALKLGAGALWTRHETTTGDQSYGSPKLYLSLSVSGWPSKAD